MFGYLNGTPHLQEFNYFKGGDIHLTHFGVGIT